MLRRHKSAVVVHAALGVLGHFWLHSVPFRRPPSWS